MDSRIVAAIVAFYLATLLIRRASKKIEPFENTDETKYDAPKWRRNYKRRR